ncbi:MAG: cation:proton antiporter [Ignavibacteriaceae bacterium]|jgi:hypothetical protein
MESETIFILLFVVATIVAIAVQRLAIPYLVGLVLTGIVLGLFHIFEAPHLTKQLLFNIFLPGLIFEAAFHIELIQFRSNYIAIFSLALPGVAAAIVLTALILTPFANRGKGDDVAIEAVGVTSTFDVCQSIVAAGGHIANIGVHGKSVELHLEKLWSRNITITTRLVDTITTPMLLKTILSGKLKPEKLITHRFAIKDIMKAYETFGNAAKQKALKVILTNK